MFFKGLFSIIAVVTAYVLTEGRSWHRPMIEFVFWTVIISAVFILALVAPDSPLLLVVSLNPHPLNQLVLLGVVIPLYSAFMSGHFFASRLVSFQDHQQGTSRFREQLIEAASRKSVSTVEHARSSFRKSRGGSTRNLDYESKTVNESMLRAKSKQEYVSRTLYRLAYSSHIRRFAAHLRGRIQDRQSSIKKVLEESTPAELNQIIAAVNVPKLFTFGTSPQKVDNILRYIVEERHQELSTIARASVLHGIMKTDTLQFFDKERQWATQLFCGSYGLQLTLLKNMLDSSGDFNNLYKFVYIDLTDESLRKRVLKHIEIESQIVLNEFKETGHSPLKILSDVDDTMSSSGGSFPAGADDRFPKHAVYPGVLSLYREIDLAARASSNSNQDGDESRVRSSDRVNITVHVPWKQGGGEKSFETKIQNSIEHVQDKVQSKYNITPDSQEFTITNSKVQSYTGRNDDLNDWKDGNLVFVSARPHVFRDISENASYRRFHRMVNDGRMHATPSMLSGNLKAGASAIAMRYVERLKLLYMDFIDFLFALTEILKQKTKSKKKAKKNKKGNLLPVSGVDDDDIDDYDEGEENGGDTDKPKLQRMESANTRATTNKNWEAVGRTKVDSMEKFSKLYPEYQIVFFGDNGQGDLMAAELLSSSSSAKDKVRMSFIHKIQANDDPSLLSAFSESDREKKWKKHNIVFFESYVEAATLAYEAGLISLMALHRIGIDVHDELMDLFLRHPRRKWDEVLAVTKRDIKRANGFLKEVGVAIPTPVLPEAISH